VSKQLKNSPFYHYTDEELVRLYVETQRNIYFEHIYDRYVDKVYRKCLSFVKNDAQAEDYTHDIFLRLVLKLSTFKEHAKFSTWLYSITYNFCLDQVRSGKKMQEQELDENFDIEEDDEDSLDEIHGVALKKALASIPIDERSMLMMKYQDDFSIKDIAEHYKITESAVKMRLKRSKEKLKVLIQNGVLFWTILFLKIILFFKS
jgi:RNA polymerase sigma factor (sigma-70 family)